MGRIGGGFRAGRAGHFRRGFAHHRIGRMRGFHRVGFFARVRHRRMHRHLLLRNYFRGRRIRWHWGPRLGYYPLPWWETAEFQTGATQGTPQVQSRQWQVTLVPYAATTVHLPPGVGPGGIFQFSHPGSTQRYLVAGPANAAPNLPVELMIPPAHIPNASDRVDVLTNLTGTDNTPAANSIDTNGDGIPDAAPFIPGQDGYVTVLQEQGSSDRLTVYVPATSLLTLKHVVDAIDSWGETSMSTRYDSNTSIIDTDFSVDLVQVGEQGVGPRWEHETFVQSQVPVAPRVVSVAVPPGCSPGSIFTVGTDITGGTEPLQVRVPAGVQPGQPLEIVVPEAATVPLAQQRVSNSDAPNPNAWQIPAGMDFYAEAQQQNFQLTVGVLEVTVRAPAGGGGGGSGRRVGGIVFCAVFVVILIIGLSVGLTVGLSGSRDYISGYTDGEACSSFYGLTPYCQECPTSPTGDASSYCWEDTSWSSMSAAVQGYWTTLGYTQTSWTNHELPSSADDCWFDLTSSERTAATNLGYTRLLWNYPYRC